MSFLPDRKSFVGASRHSVSRRDAAGGAPEKTISPGLYEIGKNVFLRVGQDNLSLIAAGVAFYAMTAIFPAIAALVSVYGLFADPHTIERLIASYADLLPANSLKLLTDALENFAGNSHSTLNAALVISVALALWSAKAGVSSLMTGLNIANETAEKRSFIVQQIVALALTIGAAILAIVALASVALIPAILGFLPLTEGVKTVLGLARWPLLAILVCFWVWRSPIGLAPPPSIPRGNGSPGAQQLRRVFGWRLPLSFPFMFPILAPTTRLMARLPPRLFCFYGFG